MIKKIILLSCAGKLGWNGKKKVAAMNRSWCSKGEGEERSSDYQYIWGYACAWSMFTYHWEVRVQRAWYRAYINKVQIQLITYVITLAVCLIHGLCTMSRC